MPGGPAFFPLTAWGFLSTIWLDPRRVRRYDGGWMGVSLLRASPPRSTRERPAATIRNWNYTEGRAYSRYSERRAAMMRRAVVEMLVTNEERTGVPWTHKIDQTFKPSLCRRTPCAIRIAYGGILALLPTLLAPVAAWMVVEKHPNGSGWHMHGVWKAPQARGIRSWWRGLKETMWENFGSCRVWSLNGASTVSARSIALAYPLKHAVKHAPTTFNRLSTWYRREGGADGHVTVRWGYRDSWWVAVRWADGTLDIEKEV